MILGLALVVGLSHYDALSEQRVQEQSLIQLEFEYTQCLARVESRTAVRNVLNGIIDLFPVTESSSRIEEYLDEEYPSVTEAECLVVLQLAGVRPDPNVFDAIFED